MNSTVLLNLTFDGKNFSGWDASSGKRTISTILKDALWKVTRFETNITPCTSLISGSHALHFFVYWINETPLPENFLYKINRCLPEDIAVRNVYFSNHSEIKPICFCYEYHIHFLKQPFLENRSFLAPHKFDTAKNKEKLDKLYKDSKINIQLKKNDYHWIIEICGENVNSQKALQIASHFIGYEDMLPPHGLYLTNVVFATIQTEIMDDKLFFIPEPAWFYNK